MATLSTITQGPGSGTLNSSSISTTLANNDLIDAINHPDFPRECSSNAENPCTLDVTLPVSAGFQVVNFTAANSWPHSDPGGDFDGATYSGVDTEYRFTLTLRNTSPNYWATVELELGFVQAGAFVSSALSDFLDFDAAGRVPAPTTSFAVGSSTLTANSLLWSASGGISMPPGTHTITFGIDVPDANNKMKNVSDFASGGAGVFSVDATFDFAMKIAVTAGAAFIATGASGIAATCGHPIAHAVCVADEV